MDGWVYVAGLNVMVGGGVIAAVKIIVSSAVKGFEKRVDTERDDRIRIDNELWRAVNDHGHKGLDGNDAKVTR